MKMKDKIDVSLVGGLAMGTLMGFLLSNSCISPIVSRAKIFQRQEKSALIRLYKPGPDGILIENLEKKGFRVRLK